MEMKDHSLNAHSLRHYAHLYPFHEYVRKPQRDLHVVNSKKKGCGPSFTSKSDSNIEYYI